MTTFAKRTISGTIYVIILLGSILASKYSFGLLFVVATGIGMMEFYNICLKGRFQAQSLYGTFIGLCLFAISYLNAAFDFTPKLFLAIIPLAVGVFIFELYRQKRRPIANLSLTLTGILYVALPLGLLNYIVFPFRNGEYNFHLLLGFLILIWTCDTGAYLFGVSLGKHKMFPRLSPKKSWEGFIGGTFLTILMGWVLSKFWSELAPLQWMILAAIIVVCGVYGDLVESLMKRSLRIKDSGNIMPGHGGLLDRFDSILLSAPIVFAYLQLIK
jgi:phosphatidate cytidylyltransferase